MLPRPLYEVLPYLYIFGALALMVSQSNWVVLICAWVLYTGGAITWVLRSDARRVNKRVPDSRKSLFLHEDIYESLPFLYIGGGVLVMRFAEQGLFILGGFAMMAFGGAILGIRITKRKISWIDEWRRYRGSAMQAQAVQRRNTRNPICDQCLIRESCRSSSFNDKSNVLIMEWVERKRDDADLRILTRAVGMAELRTVQQDEVAVRVARQRKFAGQCLLLYTRARSQVA
ncbi:hypothetical protein [Motiliproteus sp. SC1-56]|uniref:hypothetical protein n=1 Tax=Motiliproteus sp. SC1-56 TaxID=2799565 RepID=UPI001A90ACDF|nr:hypothetical protein [Motiliproteus sp. SC1-56]